MIKRIELINFMSHRHTVIEPADGLTVLVGPNNCGKSAVMAAMQILCHNDTSTYVTRHGEKECSITVETTDGDCVQWVRRRNTTKYIINGETFDRLRGNLPPVLQQVLKMPKVSLEQSNDEFDIHFGNQKSPVFLINESGRAAAGFFAASSDASRLIEMQKLHSQQVKEAARDLKQLDEQAAALNETIGHLEPVPDLMQRFEKCDQLLEAIERQTNEVDELQLCINKILSAEQQASQLKKRFSVIETVPSPPELSQTNDLQRITLDVQAKTSAIEHFASRTAVLRLLQPPPQLSESDDLDQLLQSMALKNEKVDNLTLQSATINDLTPPPHQKDETQLTQLLAALNSATLNIEKHRSAVHEIQTSVAEMEAAVEAYITIKPICPTCNQPFSKQHLIDHANKDSV